MTVDIGRSAAVTELRFELTADRFATLYFGGMKRVSRDGRRVAGREDIPQGARGGHVVDLVSAGGPLELTIDAGSRRVALSTGVEERPATYRWQFLTEPAAVRGH
jgi:hypothetical protein